MVEFREAKPEDKEIIQEIIKKSSETWLEWLPEELGPQEEHYSDPNLITFIASVDQKDVAIANYSQALEDPDNGDMTKIKGRAHIGALFVVPNHQGTGLAQELLRFMEEKVQDEGYQEAQLWTPRLNMRARRFYERQGWGLTNQLAAGTNGLERVKYYKRFREDPKDSGSGWALNL